MQSESTTVNVKGLRDDDSASITADTPEVIRRDSNAGKGVRRRRAFPKPPARGLNRVPKQGLWGRLLSNVSPDPMEILRVLDDLSELIAERVLRKIRAFHRESEAGHDVQDEKLAAIDTKLEVRTPAQYAKVETWMDPQNAEIDLINKLCDEIDKQTRLVLVLFKIQLASIGVFVTLGLMHWFGI